MSTGFDVDVRFDHEAAIQAIRVLNIAIAESEALLHRRRQRKSQLDPDWEGRASEWYQDRFSATELVSVVVVDQLRLTVQEIADKQAAAYSEQGSRVAARTERARLLREAEEARVRLESQRAETQRVESQRTAPLTSRSAAA
jgi:uncharacterized protein YukE